LKELKLFSGVRRHSISNSTMSTEDSYDLMITKYSRKQIAWLQQIWDHPIIIIDGMRADLMDFLGYFPEL
jgi:hypothetical protein